MSDSTAIELLHPKVQEKIKQAEESGKLGRARSLMNLRQTWMPGQSGNPNGRPTRKPFELEIIRIAEENPTKLRTLAAKVYELAEDGNLDAIKFIAQYIDDTKDKEKTSLQFLAQNVVIT